MFNNPRLRIYFDSIRVGHAYFEHFSNDDTNRGKVYGYYPEGFDGESEIFVDQAQIRDDRERLEKSIREDDTKLVYVQVDLNPEENQRLTATLKQKLNEPGMYYFVGRNCIEFIQEVYREMRDDPSANFINLFDRVELAKVAWVGPYAVARFGLTG